MKKSGHPNRSLIDHHVNSTKSTIQLQALAELGIRTHRKLNATQRSLAYPALSSLILGGAFGSVAPLPGITAIGSAAASIFIYLTQSNQKTLWKKVGTAAQLPLWSLLTSLSSLMIGAQLAGKSLPKDTVTTPPLPPLSLNQLSNSFKNYPSCDNEVPACKVSQDQSLTESLNAANILLSSREVANFTMRIDDIEQSEKGGWDVRGKVTWDYAAESAKAATGVGLVMGIATMLGGGTAIDGLATAASIGKDSRRRIGKCLASTHPNHSPSTEVSVAA